MGADKRARGNAAHQLYWPLRKREIRGRSRNAKVLTTPSRVRRDFFGKPQG